MRNLWQFIVNNVHLLLFLLLEVVAFFLITHYQSYPRSTFFTSANRLVASINETGDDVAAYFRLHQDNEQLSEEIVRLEQQVQDLQNQLESYMEKDSLLDSTVYYYAHLGYRFIPAKVVDLTTNQVHNYLTLNKGKRDSVRVGMGVIADGGVVGIVGQVNERFSLVIPLIHTNTSVSARILKNDQIGFTQWLGEDVNYIELKEIGRHIPVQKGDTIITSGLTSTFPEGLLIGVADEVSLNEGDNYYAIRVRLYTDYHHLRYVQVLESAMKTELDSLYSE